MSIKEVLQRDNQFKYMLLNRLQNDCYSSGSLWAGDMKEQVQYMVAIWQDLKIKPEWLTFKELNSLSIKYNRKDLTA